ncbi:AsmA family protein [Thermodesulfobacteriota bacterium]
MKRAVKWAAIISGCLLVIILAAIFLIPKFVNVQKYKPLMEKWVAETTGRTFAVGDDIRLSLFPWAGVSFSNLNLGSLPGFEEEKFATVGSFDVRVKFIPLLSKDIQVKHLIIKGARVVLEKSKDGRVSWNFASKAPDKAKPKVPVEKPKPPTGKPVEGLSLKSLAVGDVSITDGTVLWIDHTKGQRTELSNVTLRLQDVTLHRPVQLLLAARLDEKPLSIQGKVGPLGDEFGKEAIPVDLSIKALDQLETNLKGRIIDLTAKPRFDFEVQMSPFSPRKLSAALGRKFPVVTSDPQALNQVAFKAKIEGDAKQVTVSDGALDMDESKMKFFVKARDFAKPDLEFDIKLDKIDADRYLPPPSKKGASKASKESKAGESRPGTKSGDSHPIAKNGKSSPTKVDYIPLRQLVLKGTARIGKLKVKNARAENVHLKINGKNGIFALDPFSMKFYQGTVSGKGALNVQKDTPNTEFDIDAKEIQSGPLLNDVLKKDILEGTLKARTHMTLSGDTPETIKKTISGDGDLLFRDGAIKGIDLAGMVRNVQAAFGLAQKSEEKPKTDFAEFHVPFTIKRGLVNTSKTTLLSPLIRVTAAGKAHLVTESLDFRVEPKFVGTLKGQGDTLERSGIMVPVLVSGTFAEPKFKPDLEAMVKDKLEKKLEDLQKELLGGDKQKEKPSSLEEQIKGFFKGVPFGK